MTRVQYGLPILILLMLGTAGACGVQGDDVPLGLDPLSPEYQWWEIDASWPGGHLLRWSPEGSHIWYVDGHTVPLVSQATSALSIAGQIERYWDGPRLIAIEIEDFSTRQFVPNLGTSESTERSRLTLHFDIAPDGSRIAYSTCGYSSDPSLSRGHCAEGYEIAVANIDGTAVKRLTRNDRFDGFPAWSPDGRFVAYVAATRHMGSDAKSFAITGRLIVHEVATGRTRDVTRSIGDRVVPTTPVWSPDGGHIAFLAYEDHVYAENPSIPNDDFLDDRTFRRRVLFTVAPDGSNLARIAQAFSTPSWSPDGQRLALAAPPDETQAAGTDAGTYLYTYAPDGSDPVLVNVVDAQRGAVWSASPFWIGPVQWSPDGSRIMYTKPAGIPYGEDACGICLVTVDGSAHVTDARLLSTNLTTFTNLNPEVLPDLVSWSPDGSRIAIRPRQQDLLYTVDPDGNAPRILVPAGEAGRSQAEVIAACSDGVVVPAPVINLGLVNDCRMLLIGRYVLGGNAFRYLNPYTPMTEWGKDGPRSLDYSNTLIQHIRVDIRGEPLRVRGLHLGAFNDDHGCCAEFLGQIPAHFGRLTEIEVLDLSGNALSGPLPPELGNLANLEVLDLSGNDLSGPIPREMAGLVSLRELRLRGNAFTGCVPVELAEVWVEASELPRCGPAKGSAP